MKLLISTVLYYIVKHIIHPKRFIHYCIVRKNERVIAVLDKTMRPCVRLNVVFVIFYTIDFILVFSP